MKRFLFVCTGNTCRSPMAEGLFRHLVRDRADVQVSSGGLGAAGGQPPSPHSVKVMEELGIDITSLRSSPVTEEMVRMADCIFVMTYGHLDSILLLYPSAADRTFLIREFQEDIPPQERDICDPIGGSIEIYRTCRDQIRGALPTLLKLLSDPQEVDESPGSADIRLAIGADHGGVDLKASLVRDLMEQGIRVRDFGAFTKDSVDYPDFAASVAREIHQSRADLGILICKSGIGMSITANKFPGIRAALVHNTETARLCREHNDANVLCLSAAETSPDEAKQIVNTWLNTRFAGGRHQRRIEKIDILSMNNPEAPPLSEVDPDIFSVIENERERQFENIELIASENFTSRAVMEAQGSCLTNKYAEGYPGKRWYGGCEYVDVAESLAIERAKQLFGADHANVQPHSGSQANMAVYYSVLQPGDRIMTMDLSHGGHLTHGHPMNFSGKFFKVRHYGVSEESEVIDYDQLAKIAEEFKPHMITAGASAYSRIIDFARMGEIAKSVDAYLMIDMAHIAGLVAAGVHPSPVPHADFVTTTTHKTLRGPRGGLILCREPFAKGVDSMSFPGIQGGPLMHVIAAKAVCFREALEPAFQQYQQQVARNARALCEGMKKNGYRIVSGTTENHVFLVDLQPNDITGKDAQETLDKAGITVNKNAIPFDKQSPFKAGGIRIGSPAVTTRGMKEDEMFDIANFVHDALTNRGDEGRLAAIRDEVRALTSRFPLPY